jgi:hypothetical protein
MTNLYIRDLPGTTLADLAEELSYESFVWGGGAHEVQPQLDQEIPAMILGGREIPVTAAGTKAFASYFDIPPKFFARLEKDEQQWLLKSRMDHLGGELTVRYTGTGISEVYKPTIVRVEPKRLVEAALKTFPETSPIVDWWCDADELQVDVIVPEGYERFVGGDAQVNDLTRGGVRFGQDRKNNHAPWVQPFMYRLVCTNGMEVPDLGLKVDAARATAEEIEAMFEGEIRRAVDRLESDIHAFYDLRSQKLGNDPTGVLRRSALDQNLPNRTVGILEDLLPSVLGEGGDPSMFDVVNLMTNQANNPTIGLRSSSRRNLQRAGGGLVFDHAERCATCHSRLAA